MFLPTMLGILGAFAVPDYMYPFDFDAKPYVRSGVDFYYDRMRKRKPLKQPRRINGRLRPLTRRNEK